MNIKQLEKLFIRSEVPKDAYSFSGGLPNEAYCMNRTEGGKWEVYYSERGQKTGLQVFEDEPGACLEMIRRLEWSYEIIQAI